MECLCWIDLCPFACPEVNFRRRFLDPLLTTGQNRIQEWEYFESIECLDCAAKSTVEIFVSLSFSHGRSMKDPDNNGLAKLSHNARNRPQPLKPPRRENEGACRVDDIG